MNFRMMLLSSTYSSAPIHSPASRPQRPMPNATAPRHQSCTQLILVPISERALSPMSITPWAPIRSVTMRMNSGYR